MAQDRDADSASASSESQSKSRESNLQADSSNAPTQQRTKQQPHQKARHVGRLHTRVPSSKVLHKIQPLTQAVSRQNRRPGSPSERDHVERPSAHRRATSDGRLSQESSSSTLLKITSQTNIKRNRSHVDVGKRTRSTDKLKRTSSGTGISRTNHKSTKSQVHFDIGLDDAEDDEWVDASGTNSPYLSRKGSLNSSAQSSLRPGAPSAVNSRPDTPSSPLKAEPKSSEDQQRLQHKEYLTSRLLQRTPSHGAPPKMTADMAQADVPHQSPESIDRDGSQSSKGTHDGLTSRFVEVSNSGLTSEGSFYHHPPELAKSTEADPRRVHSVSTFSQISSKLDGDPSQRIDNSVLVPRAGGRPGALSAETSRTQQKLNLQRASSVIEPTQAVPGVVGVGAASPWIGVGGPGYDGGTSRDPRVGKLLERTGMEYLVVRRYQNPIARSLNRLGRLPGLEKSKRIPRNGSTVANGRRTVDLPVRHARNVSMPDTRQTALSRRDTSTRSTGAGSSFDGDDMSRLNERLSGSSVAGGSDEDDTTAMLRHIWDRSMELSASTD